jgi:hypothetical protein
MQYLAGGAHERTRSAMQLKIPMFVYSCTETPENTLTQAMGRINRMPCAFREPCLAQRPLRQATGPLEGPTVGTTPKHTLCLSTAAATGVHLCVRVTTVCKSQIRKILLAIRRRHTGVCSSGRCAMCTIASQESTPPITEASKYVSG